MFNKLLQLYNKIPIWGFTLFITLILAILAFGSSFGDSLTVDESPHIASGYSYIIEGDYRLNPEHPPLLKLLSGTSIYLGGKLTNQNIIFPNNIPAWTDRVNAQWDMGYAFLFNSGNDANTIIWWARLPTILILLLGAVYISYSVYYHTKSKSISLISLILYAFSPNIIAHGRLVTTDLIASLTFLLVIDIWIRYLKTPNWKYLLYISLAIGIAFVSKFSTILLLPLILLTGFTYIIIKYWQDKILFSKILILIRDLFIIGFGVFILINLVYFIAMRNMSVDTQLALVRDSFPQDNQISDLTKQSLANIIETPGLRYIGQYLLGQAMVIQRVSGGNTTFLLGKFTNQSFIEYFPMTYLLKENLFIIITLFSIILAFIISIIQILKLKSLNLKSQLLNNWYIVTIVAMIIIYWTISIRGNLNLGIRHILPAVILTYIVIAFGIVKLLLSLKFSKVLLSIFLSIYVLVPIINYPHYISYLNILAGNNQGYQIFTDSNLDWGQDLKRLHNWTKQENIDTLYIDYFGTADVKYYLPDVKIIPIKSDIGPQIGYTAISATMLQDSFYKKKINSDYQEYWWLAWRKPDYIIGNSILIYYNDKY
jgi:4-amino-4-deoxy-L-arabinose transferase-like glycosyltransferase